MLYSQNEIKVKVGDILEVNKTFLSTPYVPLEVRNMISTQLPNIQIMTIRKAW